LRKTFTISILLILFYTQLGYYGQFLFLQWRMKEAAREAWIAALPDAALFRVRLLDVNAQGKWEEAGRECWYKDHLYDVVRQKAIGGTVWLFCMDDEGEARLIRQSGGFTRASQDQPDKKSSHHLSLRIGDLVFDAIHLRVGRLSPYRPVYCCYAINPLPTRYTEITVPPPKA